MSSEQKPGDEDGKKTSMVCVRLPRELHRQLRVIAAQAERSLNRECIEALRNHVSRVGTPES
jgi:predicted HicB family RNase H-like nuclease